MLLDQRSRCRAFTLVELLVAIAIIAILIAILLPTLRDARRAGRRTVCMSQMRQLGVAHQSYAADFSGFIAAFNGPAGISFAPTRPTNVDCAYQAADLLAKYADRGPAALRAVPLFQADVIPGGSGTMIFEQFSHFVLVEYIGARLPAPVMVCPEDRPRLEWSRAPLGIASASSRPTQTADMLNLDWWPYSASYQLMPTAIAQDKKAQISVPVFCYTQAETHRQYRSPKRSFGGRKIHEVSFPTMKVAVADSHQRHYGRELYYAYPQARQPLLFWDGSVSVRETRAANQGFQPDQPTSDAAESFDYAPDLAWESPTFSGQPKEKVIGYYKWTRCGLKGIDYGGGEMDSKRANW